MKSQLIDDLKNRWFIEGLGPSLKKKMKIVTPPWYANVYNRAMDLECENKTTKNNKHRSSFVIQG